MNKPAGAEDWPGDVPAPWSKKSVNVDDNPLSPRYGKIIPKMGIAKHRATKKSERQNRRTGKQ